MSLEENVSLHPWESPSQLIANENALAADPFSMSFPAPELLPDQPQPEGTIVRFIFWAHDKRSQGQAIKLLEGCDIIAYEYVREEVFEDEDEIKKESRIQDAFTEILSTVVSGGRDERKLQRFKDAEYDTALFLDSDRNEDRLEVINAIAHEAYAGIFTHFIDEVDDLVRLDIDYDNAKKANEHKAAAHDSDHNYVGYLATGSISWSQAVRLQLDDFRARAVRLNFRERVAATQISKLIEDNPGKTIGVLYGYEHNLLTRLVESQFGASFQRQFPLNTIEEFAGLQNDANLRSSIVNSFRCGYYDQFKVERAVLNRIALMVSQNTMETVSGLSDEDTAPLLDEVKKIWERPIDPQDVLRINLRHLKTKRIIKKHLKASRKET
jgi:hypothetical protein